ncbi:MAG TPA: hypothetical protein VFI45_03530 [Candidatus Acidoferrum sp.]|nr:hypothetical protein [Candidatus Acidoferrum sp.]
MYRKLFNLQATFLLAALAASLILAGSARAQGISQVFVGKFTLTSTVHWGKGTLPPGSYTLRIDSTTRPVMATIHNDRYTVAARVMTRAIEDYTGGSNALQLKTRDDGQLVVRSLVVADLDMVLVFEPLSRRERVEEARADSAVVLVARK